MTVTVMLTVLCVTLTVAMIWDAATLEIPDAVPAVLAVAFIGGALAVDSGWRTVLIHGSAGFAVFVAGAVLHARGAWGGGDVKLAGALGLWFGWAGLTDWLFATSLMGGGLALILLILRRRPAAADAPAWIVRLRTPGEGIPYGIALGGGALATWGEALRFLPPGG